MKQLKSNQDALMIQERDLDTLNSGDGRGLVSQFARKMQRQSSESVQKKPTNFVQSSVPALTKHLSPSKQPPGVLMNSNLKQLREQRAAFKEYEQKYFGSQAKQNPSSQL